MHGGFGTSIVYAQEMAELGGPSTSSAIDFFNLIYKLKATKRTGWVRRGVKGPESIADHMYRMSEHQVPPLVECALWSPS